jgi:hypothetical protein
MMMPKPVTRSPGSIPRMRRTGATVVTARVLCLGDQCRRIDLLHVVE